MTNNDAQLIQRTLAGDQSASSTLMQKYHMHYQSEQQEEAVNEQRREVVKRLLQRLPESERTVVTPHYLGDMTCEDISQFLGVSPNTVLSGSANDRGVGLHRQTTKCSRCYIAGCWIPCCFLHSRAD